MGFKETKCSLSLGVTVHKSFATGAKDTSSTFCRTRLSRYNQSKSFGKSSNPRGTHEVTWPRTTGRGGSLCIPAVLGMPQQQHTQTRCPTHASPLLLQGHQCSGPPLPISIPLQTRYLIICLSLLWARRDQQHDWVSYNIPSINSCNKPWILGVSFLLVTNFAIETV